MQKKLNSKNKIQLNPTSPWVKDNLVKVKRRNKVLLDLASGSGRHSQFATLRGYKVISADLKLENLNLTKKIKNNIPINIDFETKYNWPFKDNCLDAIIITNYLHRDLFKKIFKTLKKNGILIYETFSIENKEFGRPNNPDFLLRPQELLNEARNHKMKIINYEELIISLPNIKAIQRLYAKKSINSRQT